MFYSIVQKKRGFYLKKNIKIIFPITIIVISAVCITILSIHSSQKISNRINQERTKETTKTAPSTEFSDIYNLHNIFEDLSGYKLKSIEKNKKITYYIYDFTNQDANQERDVFVDFGKELEKNGYDKIYEQADGNGYLNQYELLYNNIHFMVYTESSTEKVVLSVVDYHEDI